MSQIHPKTGASGSPVFPGHVRDPLRCFSGRARQELRFEWRRGDVGLTVPEIWPFSPFGGVSRIDFFAEYRLDQQKSCRFYFLFCQFFSSFL